MSSFNEVVEVSYSPTQNETLEKSFKDFYHLDLSPKISRVLVLPKASYMAFMRQAIKKRTPFEQSQEEMPLSFNAANLPFEIIETKTKFDDMFVHEFLNEPNGLTEKVIFKHKGETLEMQSYQEAELEVLRRFLMEHKEIAWQK